MRVYISSQPQQHSILCDLSFSHASRHTKVKVEVPQPWPTLWDPMDCSLPGSSVHGDLEARIQKGIAIPFSRIFPTQGSNPGLPHCRQILCRLRHKGSPRILEWVAYPFTSGSSQPSDRTRAPCMAGRFFTAELPCSSKFLWFLFVYFLMTNDFKQILVLICH